MQANRPDDKVRRELVPMAAIDARSVVPVSDEIGGVVLYIGGRPVYYVLNGEWFEAMPEPHRVFSSTTKGNSNLADPYSLPDDVSRILDRYD